MKNADIIILLVFFLRKYVKKKILFVGNIKVDKTGI